MIHSHRNCNFSLCCSDGPPDLLAFIITCLMTLLFFHGVKKSVMVNHVLNVFNAISWLTIVLCGPW